MNIQAELSAVLSVLLCSFKSGSFVLSTSLLELIQRIIILSFLMRRLIFSTLLVQVFNHIISSCLNMFYGNIGRGVNIGCDKCFYIILLIMDEKMLKCLLKILK